MSATFDDERHGNEVDRPVCADAQPQIIILTRGEGFIKSAESCKQSSAHHYRRRAHQTPFHTTSEDITARFAMFVMGIDTHTVAYPHFISVANVYVRVLIKEG